MTADCKQQQYNFVNYASNYTALQHYSDSFLAMNKKLANIYIL